MASNIRPARGQHTVTKRILKGFTDETGRVAVFDRAYGQRRLQNPGAGIFTTYFDSWDSRGAEERWNLFEVNFPAALSHVQDRTATLDVKTVGVLKDMVALHWLRSRGMVDARNQAVERTFERYRQNALDMRPDQLAAAYKEQTGLFAASRSELELAMDRIIEDVRKNELGKWHSEQNSQYFEAARTRLEGLGLRLHYATTRDLAIGDSPVVITIDGRLGAGPHQDVGILKADHVAMPIAPNVLVTLGAKSPGPDLTDSEVDFYNDIQWSTFDTWIGACPGGTADERIQVAAGKSNR